VPQVLKFLHLIFLSLPAESQIGGTLPRRGREYNSQERKNVTLELCTECHAKRQGIFPIFPIENFFSEKMDHG
jgi:hypothetical protein